MERKLRIGIDIDGVLRDNVGIMVDIYNLYFSQLPTTKVGGLVDNA